MDDKEGLFLPYFHLSVTDISASLCSKIHSCINWVHSFILMIIQHQINSLLLSCYIWSEELKVLQKRVFLSSPLPLCSLCQRAALCVRLTGIRVCGLERVCVHVCMRDKQKKRTKEWESNPLLILSRHNCLRAGYDETCGESQLSLSLTNKQESKEEQRPSPRLHNAAKLDGF